MNLNKNKYKKELKKLKKKEKIAKYHHKKIATTMSWCDIKSVDDTGIILKGKKPTVLKGVKVDPKNILIDDIDTQQVSIDKLRMALNKLKFDFYIIPVKLKLDVSDDEDIIIKKLKEEEDVRKVNLLENDLEKLFELKEYHSQIEFHIYIKDANEKYLEKKYMDLKNEFALAGFMPKELKELDYKNYINYMFENPMLNDFYFSSGIFDWQNYSSKKYLKIGETLDKYNIDDVASDNILSMGNLDDISYLSKLVPTSYRIFKNSLIIGDKYVSNMIVTQLPYTFNLAFLSNFVSLYNVKMMVKISPFNFDLTPAIKKDYNKKVDDWQKTTDPSLKARLEQELIAIDDYLKRSTQNNDITFNVTIIFSVWADSYEELTEERSRFYEKLNGMGVRTFKGLIMQDELFRLANPLMHAPYLPKEIDDGLGVPLQAEALAGLYPFIYDKLKDRGGMVLGLEISNGGAIIFNPFFYVQQKELAAKTNRVSGNMIVVGKTGSGKTTLMNLIVRFLIRCERNIFWIDPENKNKNLTLRYGGSYIEYGQRGNIINIFDLTPITFDVSEEKEELTDEEIKKMYDTDLAIAKAIENISIVLNYLFKEYSDEEASICGKMIRKTYHSVGIKPDDAGNYKSFKDLKPSDFPTFNDFKKVVENELEIIKDDQTKFIEREALNKINLKLERIVGEWSVYLNGYTTINTNANILSFGTKALYNLSDGLKSALKHIINSFAWSLCVKSKQPSALVHDEAHVDMADRASAEALSQEARRARKYNTVLLLGTQEPKDFITADVATSGKAIFNNSAYKFIMNLDKDPISDLEKLISLTESEKYFIEHRFLQGDALFICGNHNLAINVWATPQELNEI